MENELPEPTPEMVEQALNREHAYERMQATWATILASLRKVPLKWVRRDDS